MPTSQPPVRTSVVPVADPGCLDLDQDLVSGRGGRLGKHEGF